MDEETKSSKSIKLSLEEATAIFIEFVGNKNDVITMTISDKKNFKITYLNRRSLQYLHTLVNILN